MILGGPVVYMIGSYFKNKKLEKRTMNETFLSYKPIGDVTYLMRL